MQETISRSTSIDADDTVRTSAFASSARATARLLAGMAIDRAVRRDEAGARAAIDDASLVLETIDDPVEAARISILVGEALLALRDATAARERFERSFVALLAGGDRVEAARAVLGVARSLQLLGDARSRSAFEYAGLLRDGAGVQQRESSESSRSSRASSPD